MPLGYLRSYSHWKSKHLNKKYLKLCCTFVFTVWSTENHNTLKKILSKSKILFLYFSKIKLRISGLPISHPLKSQILFHFSAASVYLYQRRNIPQLVAINISITVIFFNNVNPPPNSFLLLHVCFKNMQQLLKFNKFMYF